MDRRKFIWSLSLGLAVAWAGCRLFRPVPVGATDRPVSFAFLADAHLPDGNPGRAEAIALARAVAEIRALAPAPHLALFAGDLAHDGDHRAIALGEEILSELPMPVLAVRGEGDGRPKKGGAGWRFFDNGRFFISSAGVNILGLDTVWQDTPGDPGFVLGASQQRWAAGVLVRLDPAAPLIVLSHAPLCPIYRPWGQWTRDRGPLLERLSRFENIMFFHGHVHQSDCPFSQEQPALGKTPPPLPGGSWGVGEASPWSEKSLAQFTPSPALSPRGGGKKTWARGGARHISLPATSWPLPSPLTGTTRKLRPGLGPRGCGWALLNQEGHYSQFRQVLWQA